MVTPKTKFTQKLYVVEMLNPLEAEDGTRFGGWLPCEHKQIFTRADGRVEANYWRWAFPGFKVRLAVYEFSNVAK